VEEPRLITEPAWFYSSLAQATAGLIGLLGGVLILRLQQQSVAIQESRDRILTELSQLRTSATSMLQTATGFIEWVKDDIRAIEDALRSGATTREVSQECDPFGSSHSGPPWRVPVRSYSRETAGLGSREGNPPRSAQVHGRVAEGHSVFAGGVLDRDGDVTHLLRVCRSTAGLGSPAKAVIAAID
jgi:hypothetical protein